MNDQYELLDSGDGKKLERYDDIILDRPCAQAVWAPQKTDLWKTATARFDRVGGLNWDGRNDNGLLAPTGVYIYRIKAGDFIDHKKMLLIK